MIMHRVKLKDRVLPSYSRGEEIFNMVSHIVGGGLGVVALVLCVVFGALNRDFYGVLSGIIFGISLILLYTMSSIYHGLNSSLMAKRVFQVFDHCTIFILIAGTYTPFCLCTLYGYDKYTGLFMFIVIWVLCLIGVVLNAIDLKRYKVFSLICYLGMGWLIIFKSNILVKLLGRVGFSLLLIGGICYTIGAIFYVMGRNNKWFHSIFHIFCVIGSLLHFLCVLLYVII